MGKTKTIMLPFIALSLILISCGGPVNPAEKANYEEEFNHSKQYTFKGGPTSGKVETWVQGKEYWDKSCSATGSWKMDGDLIVIEGVRNSNCPKMSSRNGKYKIEGDYIEQL